MGENDILFWVFLLYNDASGTCLVRNNPQASMISNGVYKMRILICDDDLLIVEKLQKYLKSYFSHLHLRCPEIVCFSDGESLLADPGDKDILFLDIEMPGLDGIYVGNELKKKDKDIIIFIITSYSEYLDEAMLFHVFRYLSKPIDRQRLFRNLKNALDLYHSTLLAAVTGISKCTIMMLL